MHRYSSFSGSRCAVCFSINFSSFSKNKMMAILEWFWISVFCTTTYRKKRMMITIVKVNSLGSVTPGFGALYFIENSCLKAKQSAYLHNFKCTLFKLLVNFKFPTLIEKGLWYLMFRQTKQCSSFGQTDLLSPVSALRLGLSVWWHEQLTGLGPLKSDGGQAPNVQRLENALNEFLFP